MAEANSSAAHEISDPQQAQQPERNKTTRSPHGPLAVPCENCHTAVAWRPIRAVPEFDHDKTNYPLRGMHEKVQCIQCHVKPVFTNVGKNCADCHADIHRRQMGSNCEQCHTVKGWDIAPQQVKDHQNRFPLFGAHAAVPCEECHKGAATGIFYGLSTECDSCHLKDWQRTTNPPHASAGPAFAPGKCQGCHNFDSWLGAKFDHSTTGFLLTNGHANLPCTACHINNNYNLQIGPNDCGNAGCHLTDWQKTNDPPHPQGGPAFAASNCYNCHQSTASWTIVTFDHSITGFLLTNGHANVPCASCHVSNNYNLQIAPTACGNPGCHLTDWQKTNNPVHSTSGPAFAAANCANCHTTVGWDAASFDHSVTGFTLVGTHMSPSPTPCASCHVNNDYTLSSTDCMTCHQSAWMSTKTLGGNVPNHVASGFPTTASACATCHPITTWSAGQFDHSVTGFPLTQGHANAQCGLCHINGNYNLTTQLADCGNSQCHLTTWQQTNNPVHSTSGPGFAASNCSKCHTPAGWDAASFDHSITGFTLVGTHMSPSPTPCASCHANNDYTLNSTDCMTCHQSAWMSTKTLGGNVPNHVATNFPPTASACAGCHPITTWSAGQFDHSTTGFPLTNSHQMAPAGKVTACTQCHIGGAYNLSIATTDCGNQLCHQSDYSNTNNPTHSSAGPAFLASNCATCHDTTAWTNSNFNHAVTGWPLTGNHQMAPAGMVTACTQCHVGNDYTFTSAKTACYPCHTTDWMNTQTMGGNVPNHVSNVFPQTCDTCHDTINWSDSTFNHASTGFPLTNAHQMAPAGKVTSCQQCHYNNNYTLSTAPTECGNQYCHQNDWNNTNNPTHSSAGAAFLASNCSNCHDTTAWTNSNFNHAVTGWPLTGGHQMQPAGVITTCAQCHVGNNYNFNTSNTACWGCHQNDYNNTQSMGGGIPNHVSNAYPHTCDTCHDTTSWADSSSTFNHNNTGFPLTGLHATAVQCAQCHTNGNYSLGLPASCADPKYSCHASDYSGTTNPVHQAAFAGTNGSAWDPLNCTNCHSTAAAFTTTSWSHASEGWALPGNHQMAPAGVVTNCNQCHTSTAGFTIPITSTPACSGCHMTDYNNTATMAGAPNHVALNYPTTCDTCHDTLVWTDSTFNHNNTGFPLTGLHATAVQCAQCHTNGNYSLTAPTSACADSNCHANDYSGTTNPVHQAAFAGTNGSAWDPLNCTNCHSTAAAFTTTSWNHTSEGWALPGNHQMAPAGVVTNCNQCHTSSAGFTIPITSTPACSGCHMTDYNNTATMAGAPNHVALNYPTTCDTCHDTLVWTDSTFNHNNTGFPLTGLHATAVQCAQCHTNGNYSLTAPTGCADSNCHANDYSGTTNPVHQAAFAGTNGSAWDPLNCTNCHSTAAAFTTTSWNHTSEGWALPGNHQMAPAGVVTNCNQCHTSTAGYTIPITSTPACSGCHMTDYTNTKTMGGAVPDHVTLNYPTTCDTCHDTVNWANGTFNHTSTGWPLTGVHATTACNLCHTATNGYTMTITQTACDYCHDAEYQSTSTLGGSVPDHTKAGYPKTCDSCHTTTTWLGATFNHTYFPIPHHSSVCGDCHQSTDYSQFTCINCHTATVHRGPPGTAGATSDMNNHPNVNGGNWFGATTCYNCHQNGGG